MRLALALGLVALLPAAVGAAPTRAALMAPLCGGGVVTLPLSQQEIPGAEQPGCCAKGCHTGGARRKHRRFDRAQ
jgi:hypothetical protein